MRNKIIEEDLARIVEGSNLPWSELEGKTALISGASGVLPAYMVETLLYLNEKSGRAKTKVIGLVRNKERALARFAHYKNRDDLELLVQDVCDVVSLDKETKIDYIIHAASRTSPKHYGKDPVGTLSPNVLGTHNLLSLARSKKAENFLFFSSGSVYGQMHPSQIPSREDSGGYVDSMDAGSCYTESKRMGETMCVSWFHQYGVPTKIVRPFHTYGPGMRFDDGRVFADFVADIVHSRDIIVKSDGGTIRTFCYISDAVAGFFTVLFKGEIGEAYNVGNDRTEISIGGLAEVLATLFPEKRLEVKVEGRNANAGYLESPVKRKCPDISKIRGLGWEPEVSLEQGFLRTVRSYCGPS